MSKIMWSVTQAAAALIALPVLFLGGCSTMNSPAAKIQIPTPKYYTLKNGLKILALEDHSLPYVSVAMMVKSGSTSDPMGKTGLASLTADLLERGSAKHDASQIADLFASYGSGFTDSVNYDYSFFSTSALSKDQDAIVDLFFEVLNTPQFAAVEVERQKSETKADIKRSYDQPNNVASRLFSQYLYGPHPYGRSSSGALRDIDNIKVQDVNDFYSQYYRPNNASLVLVGDISPGLIASLDARVANWVPKDSPALQFPPLPAIQGGQVLLVDRGDLKQSEVRLGHFGIQRNNADFLTLMVADAILSDGFTSRLMREIRVKRGLTYGIGSEFDARKDYGPFLIYSNTRNEKVGELVQQTISVVKEFTAKGVTAQEVDDAKGYLRGSFPRKIETADQLASLIMYLRFYGLDESYLAKYVENLNKIEVKDVNRVIKEYYHPDKFRILVYGPKAAVLEQLRPVGAVEVRSYKEMLTGL
jgi:zinc protease